MTKNNRPRSNFLFLDLETTGFDPEKDPIVEVGCFISNGEGDLVSKNKFDMRNNVEESILEERMDYFVTNMHTNSGLLEDLKKSTTNLTEVEDKLLEYIEENNDNSERLILAGFSVHFDKGFIEKQMPRLAKKISYQILDVTSLIFFAKNLGITVEKNPDNYTHRAIDDSVEALRVYNELRRLFKEEFKKEINITQNISNPDPRVVANYVSKIGLNRLTN